MNASTDRMAPPPAERRWVALLGVWLVYAAFGATAASLAPLLTEIRDDLGVDNATLGLILGAWPLTYLFSAIPCGLILDRIGPRMGLLIASLVIAASAALRGVAEDPITLLAAVALFGLGGPLISVGAPKLIASIFVGPARATAMGLYVTGPSVGAIATLAFTASHLLPLAGDWRGVMMLHAGLAAVSGLIWLACAAIGQVPHVRTEQGSGGLQAIKRILRAPAVPIVLLMGTGIFYINHALNNWLPEVLRDKGMDAIQAGNWAAVPAIVGLVASVTIPRFATPDRRLAVLASIIVAAVIGSLLLQLAPGPGMYGGLVLLGVARGAMITIAILLLVEAPSVPPDRVGVASGLFFTAAEVGGVLGPLTFGALEDATGGFETSLAVISAMAVGLLLLCAAVRRLS